MKAQSRWDIAFGRVLIFLMMGKVSYPVLGEVFSSPLQVIYGQPSFVIFNK